MHVFIGIYPIYDGLKRRPTLPASWPRLHQNHRPPPWRKPIKQLLEQRTDEGQPLEIWQDPTAIWLSFGDAAIQSAFDPENPSRLVLPYTEAMLSALLFQANPNNLLMLGMAGGTLAHWLSRHFPHLSITGVERSQAVHDLCQRWFPLHQQTMRCTTHITDARSYLSQTQAQFDLIFIDIADTHSSPDWISQAHFLDQCRQHLTPLGLLAINFLPQNEADLRIHLTQLRATFRGRTALLDVSHHQNIITLAAASGVQPINAKTLLQRAKHLMPDLDLPLSCFAHDIQRLNPAGSGLISA